MKQTAKVAITGGIGSGKSYVCRLLAKRGISIYDCDAAAKRLMRTSPALQQQLIQLIGPEAYTEEQGARVLNKAAVAQFLLASEANAKALDNIVHPAVAADYRASGMQWMECAILFESGFDSLVDRTVVVTAPEQLRIARIMHRDGITEAKARQWIARQWPQDDIRTRSDYEIVNDGLTGLEDQIDRLLQLLSTEGLS